MERIAEGIFVSRYDPVGGRPSLGAIIGEDQILMVDAGSSASHARSFVDALYRQAGRKPTMVCLTHWHWDHSFGLAFLNIPAYAHSRCIERLSDLREVEWTAGALHGRVLEGRESAYARDMILAEYGAGDAILISVPQNKIDDELVLDLGSRKVGIRHLKSDHSGDSLTILDETSRTLFLGDICHPDYYAHPPRYSPGRVVDLFKNIDAMKASVVLEGHEEARSAIGFRARYAPLRAVAHACLAGERDRASLFSLAHGLSPSTDQRATRIMIHAMLSGCTPGCSRLT